MLFGAFPADLVHCAPQEFNEAVNKQEMNLHCLRQCSDKSNREMWS